MEYEYENMDPDYDVDDTEYEGYEEEEEQEQEQYEEDPAWHIMTALGDSDMHYAISMLGIDMVLDGDIDPEQCSKEELVQLAVDNGANLLIVNVNKNYGSDETSRYFLTSSNEYGILFIFCMTGSPFVENIYRSQWGAEARIIRTTNANELAAYVSACTQQSGDADGGSYNTQQQPQPGQSYPYNPYDNQSGYGNEGYGYGAEYGNDAYQPGMPPEPQENQGFFRRLIYNEDGRISVRAWLLLGALVLAVVFLLWPVKKEEGVQEEPQETIAPESEVEPSEIPVEPTEDPFIEEFEFESSVESEPEPQEPSFESIYDPAQQAQQGYSAIMELLTSADPASIETISGDGYRAGILGCAASYDVNNQPIAVAAYYVENTSEKPIYFYDAMYAHASQNGKTLIIDNSYLQGDAATSVQVPIQPGESTTVYQAYRLEPDGTSVAVSLETWETDAVPLVKQYAAGN